jgi:hypothetical protein
MNTYSSIVSSLCGKRTTEAEVKQRTLHFIFQCINSDDDPGHFVTHTSLSVKHLSVINKWIFRSMSNIFWILSMRSRYPREF